MSLGLGVWNVYCVFRSSLQISDQGYWVGGEKEGFAAVSSFQNGKKGGLEEV